MEVISEKVYDIPTIQIKELPNDNHYYIRVKLADVSKDITVDKFLPVELLEREINQAMRDVFEKYLNK